MVAASPITAPPLGVKSPWFTHLYTQVVMAIIAGIAVGVIWPDTGVALQPLGDAFIKLVKMIIAPVIFLTITTGIAGMRAVGDIGRVAGRAFAYFFAVSTLALIVGLVVANVVQPGAGMNIDPTTLNGDAVKDYAGKAEEASIVKFLLNIIPTTLLSAFTEGSILQVLLVAVLFGFSFGIGG
jgi:aerobic C4-dicarboxylate transport protein